MRCILGSAAAALIVVSSVARAQSAPHATLSFELDTVVYDIAVPRRGRAYGSTLPLVSTAAARAAVDRRLLGQQGIVSWDTGQKQQGHRVKHAAVGAAIGTAAGLLVGAAVGAHSDGTVSTSPPAAVFGAIEGAGIGLLFGLVAGALVR